MKAWYFPAWNGDFRLTQDGDKLALVVEKATPGESQALAKFAKVALKKKWLEPGNRLAALSTVGGLMDDGTFPLNTTMDAAGKALLKALKPKRETLTAFKYANGNVEVAHGSFVEALAVKAPKAEKAASVARPTPCCPLCVPGSIDRASEVLLSFLTPEQHETWAKKRAVEVIGSHSGHRYILSHRHTPRAVRQTKICLDADEGAILHFHDTSVPPEEEVLAAKLILEHCEPWLRNEATVFHATKVRYKNPFGNGADGTASSAFTHGLGAGLLGGVIGRSFA